MRKRERERVYDREECVRVCMYARERVCVCVCMTERETECVCVYKRQIDRQTV